uniref:Uncharacterized protein n=1 Tax=Magallana gigas TaxID=29159 RepID=A0A8W8JNE3_MAGGI
MEFKPALLSGKEVRYYVWNKVRGVNKDPSFAKFEPRFSPQLEIYFNEEHQTPSSTVQAVKGYKQVKVCDDKTSGSYSCCNTAGTCLVQVFQESMAFAQKSETVRGCIAGNVTMQFKPALLAGREVKTYVWNKVRGIYKDPSFAKFEPSVSSQLEIYYNEEHQVQNRLIHYPDEPATLYLTYLRKSDQEQYTIVINYVDYVGTPTEYIIELEVQDVCFEKPRTVDKCAVTTCYTGDNGVLKVSDVLRGSHFLDNRFIVEAEKIS